MSRSFYSAIFLTGSLFLLSGKSFGVEPSSKDPIYIRIDNGWEGLYGHNNEYAEFEFKGRDVELQDANHILLAKGVGMMVTFADSKEFRTNTNLLSDHVEWELNYWRSQGGKVESVTQGDLSGERKDLRVTQITVSGNERGPMVCYLVGLVSTDGVFVLSVSPADKSTDPLVKEIANSFKLVHRKLDAEEVRNISRK